MFSVQWFVVSNLFQLFRYYCATKVTIMRVKVDDDSDEFWMGVFGRMDYSGVGQHSTSLD